MNVKKTLGLTACVLLAATCFAQGRGSKGNADLKAVAASITIGCGRPARPAALHWFVRSDTFRFPTKRLLSDPDVFT